MPGEALADAGEAPHEVTTPDDPAEEVVIDDEGGATRRTDPPSLHGRRPDRWRRPAVSAG